MVLVQKWPFFELFFLRNIGQENVFYDILVRKNVFLGYKNKNFHKSKNWHFSKGVNPSFWSKNGHFWTFWTSCFYSLERRLFAQEYRKRHFSCPYFLQKKVGKMANFGPKPWVNPFGNMSIFRLVVLLVFIA